MPLQYINELLGLPELQLQQLVSIDTKEVHLEASPVAYKQPCPLCHSEASVKRDGRNRTRQIRHLSIFGRKSYLHVPSIRMTCTRCRISFVWIYDFVGPKQRYSQAFRAQTVEQTLGSTAVHSALMQQAPVSTVQRMHQEALPKACEHLTKQAWREAEDSSNLVLGIDDFAIKKGHTYNTGIHNLRGETMLDLWAGRKLEDLRAYAQANPQFLALKPKAVVMDLAKAYHTWITECFPHAIRIADRFHVHGYVIESVQEIRKSIQHTVSPRAKATLKSHHRLLNPPIDQLCVKSKAQLESILAFSPLLRSVWEWKESFSLWYDCSPDINVARLGFMRWLGQGETLDHPAVRSTLKTMRNWQEEIVNYHHCRFTNATVEGRHNRIKAYQRRHYFTRNQECYKAGILVECNRPHLTS
ncbi:transposase IS204/IS1001/IS1096/IS1165 family protein [Paenibacillus terrae HPL-003]|uniref:Transposase IS204/IS1001/IS1096/IS1165 family protein n=1 Tax=Paenibacillus terrae (strain HPL-003) TaxID=985665 RepID=G7VQM1_PAETH|nr:ISL3 family transposase [Paenibacillus terrae]AET61210.1 transposase IS204/IS1001/IS1096/IS1165 family protein [Paenibacillus terrae HPL-003]